MSTEGTKNLKEQADSPLCDTLVTPGFGCPPYMHKKEEGEICSQKLQG